MPKLFDSHFHIINSKFPLTPGNGYFPDEFKVSDYLSRTKGMDIAGGALISGSFQGFDQNYLVAALYELGPNFVGVTQIQFNTPDEEIYRLNKAGVKAVRFNIERGGSEKLKNLEKMARRVYELCGWHIELYIDSAKLKDLFHVIADLPSVSIDHLGLSKSGFDNLLKLVERGVRVKATGFGRVDLDVKTALIEIATINSDALMFGTDLPSTRSPRPFRNEDIYIIRETLDQNSCEKIFYENAASFYKLK